ncbi:MAG: c-type cytochrome [Azonexus sp.]|jgi:cytochrome c|nr:c-type cytochrome [Azonexus sp.]
MKLIFCPASATRPRQRRRCRCSGVALGAAFGAAFCVAAAVSAVAQAAPLDVGRTLFRTNCALCHSAVAGDPPGVGPNLHGVLGRDVATLPGFTYTPALAAVGGSWDAPRLLAFLTAPAEFAPGTAMPFAGLKSERERRALVCFLGGDAQAEVCR